MDLALVLGAAFFAGILNAAAGGGSFLTLPALVAVGVPPVMANATGTLALLPGYFAGAWAMRRDLFIEPHRVPLWRTTLIAAVGGAVGALLLLWIDQKAFRHLVPWLLLAATLIFWCAPAMLKRTQRAGAAAGNWRGQAGLAAVSVYGGFFNGGIGIMLLALFSASGYQSLNTMNALKNLLSGVLTCIAVVVYVAGALIDWQYALLMLGAALAGGYVGGRLARRIPRGALRAGIIAIGLAMTAFMFMRA
ncbi:sulfite exporter TauE/SafE family protein [Bordetella genomosp. 6]|uniref:sulfite exporter TauE/SafE family protein n=1 Tax=Bordetella genomosp. 6 TaxID=463024 RepID=UPI000A2941EB|nr:sulfite exporter TauE/SafE family protein [Bordetella genomosp. 6]ARP75556.1 hypothetical protein CAL11_05110 [Bordetella genomosp. 6]